MSHDNHNNNGHSEPKSVAFTTPLILGVVAVFIILCFVSLGNPCHGCCEEKQECSKECMEACMKGDHSKHPAGMEHCSVDMKGCGKCEGCKEGKECSEHHAEKGCGECDGCKAGKECTHHADKGCGECEGCKAGKECSHHAEHATETAAVTDSTKHEEPAKEEGHH